MLESAEAIFNKLTTQRKLELNPPPPTLSSLQKDFELSSTTLKEVRTLLTHHIKQGRDILIFGDYDADGITASAVMYETLTLLTKGTKSRILPFIPSRARHGYGLSARAIKDIFSGAAFVTSSYPDFSPSLIITVDNGIVANKEVGLLRNRGVDVIITDHHQSGTTLPNANYVVHSLVSSGAGLAWVTGLFLSDFHPQIYSLLDLATIGIVADQMPLTGVNRQLVTHGLHLLNHTHNSGLLALYQAAGIQTQTITTYHINYVLAPRLNAAGRLADATDALRLLCSRDSRLISKLAHQINAHNEQRQELTGQGVASALQIPVKHNLVIVASSDFHEGVIGLIAGRLAEQHHRPAIAISIGEDFSKGSARSVNGINITNLLRQFSDLFEGLGGHELAAGFSLRTKNLTELTTRLENYADQHLDPSLLIPTYAVDGLLTLKQTSLTLARLLTRLEPFGLGNPKPRFLVRDLKVIEDRSLGKNGQHHRLTLEQAGLTRQAIWFNLPVSTSLTQLAELAFTIDINAFRGKESLQLVVKHANL